MRNMITAALIGATVLALTAVVLMVIEWWKPSPPSPQSSHTTDAYRTTATRVDLRELTALMVYGSGSTIPYAREWEVVQGELPNGVALNPNGTLHISRSAKSGRYSFTLAIVDADTREIIHRLPQHNLEITPK